MEGDGSVGQKRRSRFDEEGEGPQPKKLSLDISAAAAKAAEISKQLSSKIAAMSSMLGQINASKVDRKSAYRPLLLDDQGREIDEQGNLVKHDVQQVKTLAANLAVSQPVKKKENPYLSHRSANEVDEGANNAIVDERLPTHNRMAKVRKALQFIEPGKFVQEASKLQEKEENKIIAGYASGRKKLQQGHSGQEEALEAAVVDSPLPSLSPLDSIPPPPDSVTPSLEWWDEAFLPKLRREQRKISKAAAAEKDDFALLSLANSRTYKYIQHPLPIKPLIAELQQKPLPMYLTKKERKKLRKANRQEREREKRDKQMLGLIPAPEPKFKLSNFMKILGDQAVADPSKVELKVLQQMQQRVLNHEMRNQAAKLTPKERKEKKIRKLQEDTSKGVYAAVFRVTDFSSLKHRFKVDVNAQQLFLSGIVLLCEEAANLVVAEGGPKSIRKFIRLLTERIDWTAIDQSHFAEMKDESLGPPGVAQDNGLSAEWNYASAETVEQAASQDSDSDSQSDSDDDGDDDSIVTPAAAASGQSLLTSASVKDGTTKPSRERRCDLLWTGTLPKKVFSGFKYQESKTAAAARKVLEAKGVAHYWDMLVNADQLISSATSHSLF